MIDASHHDLLGDLFMLPTLPLPLTGPLPGLLDTPLAELQSWLSEQGEQPWRAKQLRRWLFRGADSFDAMTDLSKALRNKLLQHFRPFTTSIARHQQADDGTHKLLIRCGDGHLVECVLIQEDDRRTACISTQVGCGMGCVFCASGLNGVERNLSAGEILEQLLRLRNLPALERIHTPDPQRLTHIVVMGMGEPLANLDNLVEALEVATSPEGLGIGARHITISTVGLPAKIRRLADLGKQYHLAVSLHAPNDALRTQIVPTNDKTGLEEILAAADYFHDKTNRQVTFEYVLLADMNDHPEHARELARLLQGRQAYINVIPFNDVEGLSYCRPSPEALADFLNPLKLAGLHIKVRKRKGSQIDAACGQLRRSSLAGNG